jgi:putative oxidoreductase
MYALLLQNHRTLVAWTRRWDWLAPLAMRLFFGYFWLETGWAKLHNLEGFASRFGSWGIPFPEFSAALSAGTEFVGGALLMLGLMTRPTALIMAFNMLVALLVVAIKPLETFVEFFEIDEPLYILIFVYLAMQGAGAVSLDALIARKLDPKM